MTSFSELILGGARSGKSKLAEQRAIDSGLQLVYVATATAGDNEMSERIAHHQSRRDAQWLLVEEPLNLAAVLQQYCSPKYCVLIDCLTLWLSNCLHQHCWDEQRDALLNQITASNCSIIFVSNETGMGITPMGELSRQFVDNSGFLHQTLAQHCDRVTLTVAGLPMQLKPAVNYVR